MAAGCARRSAHGGFGHAGLSNAEDGNLRHGALLPADFSGRCSPGASWIVVLAIIGIIYGALVAMVQPNMKKLVAYSSVSHLGFVVLGIFSFTQLGLDGAVYQMLNHGISTGALFVLVGFLYERRHSLEITGLWWRRDGRAVAGDRFSHHDSRRHRASDAEQFRRRVPGLARRRAGNFRWADFRRHRSDSFGLLYALALSKNVFRRNAGGGRHHMHDLNGREWARSLRYSPDGLDGHSDADFPPSYHRLECADSATVQRQLRNPGPAGRAEASPPGR